MMRLDSLVRVGEVVDGRFEVAPGVFETTRFRRMEDGIRGISEEKGYDVFRHHRGSAEELREVVRLVLEFFRLSDAPE